MGVTFLALLVGVFGISSAERLYGVCDFETSDFCGLSENHGFEVEQGRPSLDYHAMDSGYNGEGYLLLRNYNSDNTITTPPLTLQNGKAEVHFAYFLNGNGEYSSYIHLGIQTNGEDPIIHWTNDRHDHSWHYVTVSVDIPSSQEFQVVWVANAHKNTWTQQHAWLGLDFIEVAESGVAAGCYYPSPVQYARPWECVSPSENGDFTRFEVRETLPDGTQCTTSCLDGFLSQGEPILTCNDGAWEENGEVVFMCFDTTAPVFGSCPEDLTLETPFGWASLWYTIGEPNVSDNSGDWDYKVYLNDELQEGKNVTVELYPGTYTVLYEVNDLFMNENSCTYNIVVSVSDKESPTVNECPVSRMVESDSPLEVTWKQPVFQDNSGYIAKVESNYVSGSVMAWGVHDVMYTAYDNSSNSVSCSFTITVRGLPCKVLDIPVNGALVCHDSYAGRFCVSMCGSEGEFEVPSSELSVPDDYLCSASGNWYPYEFTYDCLAPYGTETVMSQEYYFQGECNDTITQDSMRSQALTIYSAADADITMGTNLTSSDFYVRCDLDQ